MELKRILKFVFLLVILFSLSNCKKTKTNILANQEYTEAIKEARKTMYFYLTGNLIPGASIAISKGGEIIYSEGFGQASKDLDVDVTRKTKFRIGSVSEIYTSLIYQILVENGTLHPDSSVQFYLPDFPKKEHKITLNNLIQHTSGIRDENIKEKNEQSNSSILKGINHFKNDELLYEPGMHQFLSIYNYNLLGAIMEKATSKKFNILLEELITDTLHLENTVIDNPLITIKDRTNFFVRDIIAQVVNAPFYDSRFSAPSQGLLSNAEDLVKFGNAILKSDYISDNIRKKLFTPHILSAGMPAKVSNGWKIKEDTYKRKYYFRSGEVIGGGAIILIIPDEEVVVAGIINTTMSIDEIPIFKITDYFIPKPEINAIPTNNETEKNIE